ncbi:putative wall-associated receptor kinase-like 16 isoform X2 [Phoenix dactylifera]|uniref:Wall-associated receptor kinase-like 16 isoform X2 n=1 Tax=Phoenix dactylifera TaxID=42345 RepID=A0A8B8ZKF0_PHODC|nr:putative wall-associated receptor kinase-like 16 isoform X2 [Phoenix dactylifera]
MEQHSAPLVRKKLERMVWQAALLVQLASLAAASGERHIARSGCQAKCGNVSIPYPFGIGEGCFLHGFEITCNTSFNPPKAFLGSGNIDVEEIQLLKGRVVVNKLIARDCYAKNGSRRNSTSTSIVLSKPYMFSSTRNKFVAIGCDTIGRLEDMESKFETGCLSLCNSTSYITNGTCNGIGCCETVIPKKLRSFEVYVSSFRNHTECWDFNPCSYGFLADEGRLNFSVDSFSRLASTEKIPVTLSWAVRDKSCEEARNNRTSFACKAENSYCVNSTNGGGYRCNCSEGFEGNPYLEDGCQDIDECASSPCVERCENFPPGNYTCRCPWHMYGDGKKNGSGCKSISKLLHWVLGSGFGLLVLAVLSSLLYLMIKKRRHIKLKEKFFKKNGGLLLQQQLSSLEGSAPVTRLFTTEELLAATDNYLESRILGQGGAGTVYKGILSDKTIVAIKKSRISDDSEIELFINEVVVLSQINHRNVVKLLGCCLETRVPLLVFEFVPNGSLAHMLHSEGGKASLFLECRLRIATEVAGALAYLHSAASVPIIHRDVKPSNILLDENYTAKVSDFGTSRLVPFNQKAFESLIRGTFGYVDPEYFLTGMFTDKSDVYSFGVVLVELLTGEKPVVPTKSMEFTNLALQFGSHVKEGRLLEILEQRLVQEGSPELLLAVAELATRCLSLKWEERPTMKEVAMELEGLRTSSRHPWVEKNEEEGDRLTAIECSTSTFGEGDSSSHIMLSFDISRCKPRRTMSASTGEHTSLGTSSRGEQSVSIDKD